MYIHCVRAYALFANLQLGWATTMGRLLHLTTCLPHEDEGISFSALPNQGRKKQACQLVFHSILFFYAERQTGKL